MVIAAPGAALVAGSLILQEVIIGLLSALLSLGLLAAGLLALGRLDDLLPSALQGLHWVGTEQLLIAPRRLVLGALGGLIGAILALSIYR
jgi:hypothetical protein